MADGFRRKTWGKSIISHGLPGTTGEQESYGKKKKSSVKGEGNNFTQEGRTPVILSTINNCMLI